MAEDDRYDSFTNSQSQRSQDWTLSQVVAKNGAGAAGNGKGRGRPPKKRALDDDGEDTNGAPAAKKGKPKAKAKPESEEDEEDDEDSEAGNGKALQMEKVHDDFITKFQDFTGIEKREMSRNYFEKSKDHYGNWNLEDALSMFYDDPESNFSQNDSMLPKANGNRFDLEFFVKAGDAGFYQIAINICSNLGLNDMKSMREVNKTIKNFMDEERMIARLLTKPIIFRREILSAHDFEEFNRWIEFISVVKKEGTLPELFSLIPINRKYLCIEPNFLPISPLKVAVTLKSKEILNMLKKYGLMDSEEKPDLTVKFMKYACKALKWAQRDEEVNNVLDLNNYQAQISAEEPFHHPIFGFDLWRPL